MTGGSFPALFFIARNMTDSHLYWPFRAVAIRRTAFRLVNRYALGGYLPQARAQRGNLALRSHRGYRPSTQY